MDTTKLVIPPGGGATWQMAPGRSAALKITSDMAQSVMMFEEVAPTDTVTDLHIHHDSDEIAYVLAVKSPSRSVIRSRSADPGPVHSCRAGCHTPGRVLALRPDVFFSYTPPVMRAASSKRPCAIIAQ